jgi:hypothetical protein
MMHFQGLIDWEDRHSRMRLCSTRAAPVRGPTTDRPERVACPECRKILKLRALPPGETNNFDSKHWSDT